VRGNQIARRGVHRRVTIAGTAPVLDEFEAMD
jgi:hypothetical protein